MINLKQLLKEDVQRETIKEGPADLVRKGLEKVFESSDGDISYRRLENVGLGYIKNVSEAIKIAVKESRKLAEKYGYSDNEIREIFIKTPVKEEHSETNMSNPEEKQEVQIGNQIKELSWSLTSPKVTDLTIIKQGLVKIHALAEQLLSIHGAK